MYLNYRWLVLVLVCSTGVVSGMSVGQHESGHSILRGTLNVVLANKNGFVVITDSMVTAISGQEVVQLSDPAQKLFQLDERTVATIAGFGSGEIPTAPEFNTSAAGILARYIRQLGNRPDSTLSEKLTSLSFTFNFYLSSYANIRDVILGDTPPGNYEFQSLLAGYDPDGTPRIARLILRTGNTIGPDGQRSLMSIVRET